MIESIEIKGIASYGSTPQILDGLSEFNFLFGSNGSGKTTITKVIADEDNFLSCNVTWKGRNKLQTVVYNRDFVKNNFGQSAKLKGIFTLGKENLDTNRKIKEAKEKVDEFTKEIENWTSSLENKEGLKSKFKELDDEFRKKCWKQKQKHDKSFSDAFQGFRGSAESFKGQILHQRDKNSAPLEQLSDLKDRAEEVFGEAPVHEAIISMPDGTNIVAIESNPFLKKAIIGKTDVDIAAMIQKLENSDWVKLGRPFYEKNDMFCPFCQQSTTTDFVDSLNDYFDETFQRESEVIGNLLNSYRLQSKHFQNEIEKILGNQCRFLNNESLKSKKTILDSKITLNLQRLDTKKKEPSRSIELESIAGTAGEIQDIINTANTEIGSHNKMVDNHGREKRQLTDQVWRYVLEEFKSDLDDYEKAHSGFKKGIEALTEKIKNKKYEKTLKENEIRELERQRTSIKPTIDAINGLLISFGFQC